MTDSLAPARVTSLLRGRFGSPFLYRERCESTQRLLAATLPEGALAVCEHQSEGRGRLGRRWDAPAGAAILCSLLLHPPPGRPIPQLSLVGGVAVARTVERALGRPAAIKWPNDVLVEGRKVAGVLAEARDDAVVLGTGINVNQTASELPPASRPPAASLRSLDGVRRDRAELLAEFLWEIERAYETWCREGLAPLLPELGARDCLKGRLVAVGGLEGTALGIGKDGLLELDVGGERRVVGSGEVSAAG